MTSLEAKLQSANNIVDMMRATPTMRHQFQYPTEHGGWFDEQWAWKNTCILFDQSFHMNDLTIRGPDALQLLTDTGINDFSTFGKGKAKQYVAVNHDGYVIGDEILFGLDDNHFSLVGVPIAQDWLMYIAETEQYKVEVHLDMLAPDLRDRRKYRYQITGPLAQDVLEKAQGSALAQIKFFHMGQLSIAGRSVTALNHGMAKVPGKINGLELMGPSEDAQVVLDAILEAGQEFGLRRGGSRAYPTAVAESGWIAVPMPAIYTGEQLRPYREWLPAASMEGFVSIEGSYETKNIEDYYATPWDLGYGHLIKNSHDFIGKSALEAMADQPHRKKVWLEWHNDDVRSIIGDALFNQENAPRLIDVPSSFSAYHYDKVMIDDRLVGLSTYTAYTVANGCYVSLGMVDEADAVDGQEVIIIWGEPEDGIKKPMLQPHVQTEVRATIHTSSLVA